MPTPPAGPPGTLLDRLADCATRFPAHGFHCQRDFGVPAEGLSFAELDGRARRIAAKLCEFARPGDRVLLAYPTGVEFIAGLFGCLYAGLVAVPIPVPRPHRADARYENIVRDCAPVAALTHLVAEVRSLPDRPGVRWLDTSTLTGASGLEPVRAAGDDLAVLQYTSGSTGSPKGVRLTHANLLHNTATIVREMDLRSQSHVVCALPLFHDMGLIGNVLSTLQFAGRLTLMSPTAAARDPLRWLQVVSELGAEVTGGPCFLFRQAARRVSPAEAGGLNLERLRVAYVGAEPIAPEVLDRFAAAFASAGFRRESFFPCYGLAEATLLVTGGPRRGPHVGRYLAGDLADGSATPADGGLAIVGCGRAVEGTAVAIRHQATGEDLPERRVGEVVVRGPGVATGYWSGEAIGPELRTGDLGFLDGGQLFVTGRLKEVVILRGRNYYPQDLERVVAARSPATAGLHAAAFAPPGEAGEEPRLHLIQEWPRGTTAEARQDFFDAAAQSILEDFGVSLFKVVFVTRGAVGRTTSGKVRRGDCCARYLSGELGGVEVCGGEPRPAKAPAAPAAGTLAEKLRQLLAGRLKARPDDIDPDRPFASYGLDSLTLAELSAEVEAHLGRPVPVTALYNAPTVNKLAALLGGPARAAAGPARAAADARVAVVGMACRFPGAADLEAFWELLKAGGSGLGELPAGRWPARPDGVPTRGGYLAGDVRDFDPEFFGVAPSEAASIDPQHRLVLETAWQALDHAGVPPDSLAGRSVGVFIGCSGGEYARIVIAADALGGHSGTGLAASMAAHRVSYHFDLRGPSVVLDTACSSALAAVHAACGALRSGECELALAGGVNLLLTPETASVLARAGMLSPGGRCRTFAEAADGYARGEGCGVVVLKPYPAALAAGDRTLGVVEAVVMNQDGRTNGIAAPSGPAQVALIRAALESAGRAPGEVSYLEAHGTGTRIGDPIEVAAALEALGAGAGPCYVASVKANVGHLEAAAGVAGFIKAVLQLDRGHVAPHPLDGPLNRLLAIEGTRLRIPRELTPWAGPRVAGVSSFGFGGTNVHAVVSSAPPRPDAPAPESPRQVEVVPLSADSPAALTQAVADWSGWLAESPEGPGTVARAAARQRRHFPARRAAVGRTNAALADDLRRAPDADPPLQARGVVLLFTGQGAQYPGMGRDAAAWSPAYRVAFDECADAAGQALGEPLAGLTADPDWVHTPLGSHVGTLTVGYCLARTWASFGVRPAAVAGYSLGEFAACVLAGAYTLGQAFRLVVARGRALEACPAGAMFACDRGEAESARLFEGVATVSAANGPSGTVVSCDLDAAPEAARRAAAAGVSLLRLAVPRAYHSPAVAPALPALRSAGQAERAGAWVAPFFSAVTGDEMAGPPDAEYWVRHARQPVRFAAALERLLQRGFTHFVEVGPAGVLCGIGAANSAGRPSAWIPSFRRGLAESESLARAVGRLYACGADLNWDAVCPGPRRVVSLPSYPFQRLRYGFDAPVARGAAPPDLTGWVPASNWAEGIDRTPPRFGEAPSLLRAAEAAAPAPAAAEPANALRALDALAAQYARQALHAVEAGGRPTLPAYERLRCRLGGAAAGATGLAPADPAAVLERFPSLLIQVKLLTRCGEALADVMTGRRDPVEVLFDGEAGEWLGRLYRESPTAAHRNALLAEAVRVAAARLSLDRPVRILEVGAGTGGTTRSVLAALPPGRFEYVFTDVSAAFLAAARREFGERPEVEYRLLDLERPPAGQGFAPGQFDVVVAANVLHAMQDVSVSAAHARALLAPGGLLAVIEGTRPQLFLDLVFGVTPGWWRFRDTDLRATHALLPPAAWGGVFAATGFDSTAASPDAAADPDQVVILARADASRPAAPAPSPVRSWVLRPATDALALRTAAQLLAGGQSVRLGEPGPGDACVIDFAPPACVSRECWTVAPPCAGAPAPPERRVALDPEAPLDARAALLCQSVLNWDGADHAYYRGDQRYRRAESVRPRSTTRAAPAARAGGSRESLDALPVAARAPAALAYLRGEFADLLGLDETRVDVDTPLTAYGLDSLLAIQLHNRIGRAFGKSVTIVELVKGMTLREAAGRVADAPAAESRLCDPSALAALPAGLTSDALSGLTDDDLDTLFDTLFTPPAT